MLWLVSRSRTVEHELSYSDWWTITSLCSSSIGTRKPDGTLSGTLKAHFDEFDDAHKMVRTRNQEIPWTAARGLHDTVHFPR